MDAEKFVQNVQYYCTLRGTTPTAAGKESGAGKDLVSRIKHSGVMPSVEKVQLLAAYLGVTTSDLLGEIREVNEKEPAAPKDSGPSPEDTQLMALLRQISPEGKQMLIAQMQGLLRSQEPSPDSQN